MKDLCSKIGAAKQKIQLICLEIIDPNLITKHLPRYLKQIKNINDEIDTKINKTFVQVLESHTYQKFGSVFSRFRNIKSK